MTLRLYNTLTRTKELFEPLKPGEVGMYLCGPTVYKPSHIGHAVGPIIFDVLKRYLTFKGFAVRLVVNVTDVDDKLIAEAAAQGTTVPELARRVEENYVESMRRLGVRTINEMPRASEHIDDIIRAISGLIERGYAYATQGSVYFDISKDADYGRLSNRRPEELLAGTRSDLVEAGKRNPGDFALWKAAKPGEPAEVIYASPWGPGRPGWHIECSAMSSKYLGETFDIHGGGMDLIFPHHENEIAQAESLTGKVFARFWLHNGLTRFNTKKISKSDAEMAAQMSRLTLSSLLDELGPELLRFVILSSHYRSPLDFSDETIGAARKGLQTFYRLFERIARITGRMPYENVTPIEKARLNARTPANRDFVHAVLTHQLSFLAAMDDDLNTAAGIGVLFEMAGEINRFIDSTRLELTPDDDAVGLVSGAGGTLVTLGRLLGLFEAPPEREAAADDALVGRLVDLLLSARRQAREARQFPLADQIRAGLNELGITIEDGPEGTRWRRD